KWRNKLLQYNLSGAENKLISELSSRAIEISLNQIKISTLEFSNRENEIEDWLNENKIGEAYQYAASIVSLGYTLNQLQELQSQINKETFFIILIWSAHQLQINSLLIELKESSGRISEIVSAMK